jgi:hypothetical protein
VQPRTTRKWEDDRRFAIPAYLEEYRNSAVHRREMTAPFIKRLRRKTPTEAAGMSEYTLETAGIKRFSPPLRRAEDSAMEFSI